MNTIFLSGRLTKDIELKQSKAGKSYTRFTLASRRDKENTDFINCVAFGNTAEILQSYTSKGMQIVINGSLQVDKDKEGKTHHNVIVNSIEIMEKKSSEKTQEPAATEEDEFPF